MAPAMVVARGEEVLVLPALLSLGKYLSLDLGPTEVPCYEHASAGNKLTSNTKKDFYPKSTSKNGNF